MSIQWTNALESGIQEIDHQHKELFRCMNSFFDTWMGKKSIDEITMQFRFLEQYVITHFAWEEKFMEQFNYPSFDDHKTQHQEFALKFTVLKNDLDLHGPSEELLDETSRLLISWLMNHIHGYDIKMGAFLKKEATRRGLLFLN